MLHEVDRVNTVNYNINMDQWKPKQIKALRESLKLTQEAFGDLIGVTRTYVNLMEKGVKEPSKTLKVLFSCLEKTKEKGGKR